MSVSMPPPVAVATEHALLVPLGHFAAQIGRLDALAGVPFPIETVDHSPGDKLGALLAHTPAGGTHVDELATSTHPLTEDGAVATAWGQETLASASGVNTLLRDHRRECGCAPSRPAPGERALPAAGAARACGSTNLTKGSRRSMGAAGGGTAPSWPRVVCAGRCVGPLEPGYPPSWDVCGSASISKVYGPRRGGCMRSTLARRPAGRRESTHRG